MWLSRSGVANSGGRRNAGSELVVSPSWARLALGRRGGFSPRRGGCLLAVRVGRSGARRRLGWVLV